MVGYAPPLDRLAVREISPRYLSQDERIVIADLLRSGLGVRQIADKLGREPSTVSRELRRNSRRDGAYRPFEAHRWAVTRRTRCHRRRVEKNPQLCEVVAELLAQRWSPQQIAGTCADSIPMTGRCGCATKASIRLSINPIRP